MCWSSLITRYVTMVSNLIRIYFIFTKSTSSNIFNKFFTFFCPSNIFRSVFRIESHFYLLPWSHLQTIPPYFILEVFHNNHFEEYSDTINYPLQIGLCFYIIVVLFPKLKKSISLSVSKPAYILIYNGFSWRHFFLK